MPNLLPIGTEYDKTYLGLRLRVVGHHKDQFGQLVNDVVKVGELPRTGRVAKRTAPILTSPARAPSRPQRRATPRRRYYYRRPLPPAKPVKVPWTTSDYIKAWVWGIVIVGGILLYSTCDIAANLSKVHRPTNGPSQTQEIAHDDTLRHYPCEHAEAAGIARSPGGDDPQALRYRTTARADNPRRAAGHFRPEHGLSAPAPRPLAPRSGRPGDVVVVTKLDRLGRTARDILDTLEQFAKRGVRVIVIQFLGGQNIDMDSTVGRLVVIFFAGLASSRQT